ncbi:MAG: hypothetical protein WBG40_22115 [Candidatus Sulfotelmatobacter sp.]
MATADKKSLFVHGENGGQMVTTGNPITDLERAARLGPEATKSTSPQDDNGDLRNGDGRKEITFRAR